MVFQEYRSDILSRATTVGGEVSSPAQKYPKQADAVIAASAKVVSGKGLQWCIENPAKFKKATWQQLSSWYKIAIFIAGFFVPGGSLWITLLNYLVPIIFQYLTEQQATGRVLAGDLGSLGTDAETFIKNSSK